MFSFYSLWYDELRTHNSASPHPDRICPDQAARAPRRSPVQGVPFPQRPGKKTPCARRSSFVRSVRRKRTVQPDQRMLAGAVPGKRMTVAELIAELETLDPDS